MVLVVVLILLGILTIIVASLVRTSNVNFRIVGNQQYREEARLTSQLGIESYISTAANFAATPTATKIEQMSLDGVSVDYSAEVPPATCLGARTVTNSELSDSAADIQCRNALNYDAQLANAPQTNCKDIVWDVQAAVNDPNTGTSVELHQGIAVRSKVSVSCP